jgi:hypothetical protein
MTSRLGLLRSQETTLQNTASHALMSHNEHVSLDEGTITETSTTEKLMWYALSKLNVMPKFRVCLNVILYGN